MTVRLIRLPEVLAMTSLSKAEVYLRIKRGTFPQPLQLGARAVAWDASEIETFIKSLPRGCRPGLVPASSAA